MDKSTNNNNMSVCASCGKGEEESIGLKKCSGCMSIRYCSAACQQAHRSQHKKECRKRAAELHDEALFKQPPKDDDCPICFLTLPLLCTGKTYMTCCGKVICSGCIHAVKGMDTHSVAKCPFCRTPAPAPNSEEIMERMKKRMEVDDAQAIYEVGCCYYDGMRGFPQDRDKGLELWHRAAELGYAASYSNIGVAYFNGACVGRDEKKAMHYFELAAIGGDVVARHNLGLLSGATARKCKSNYDRALKHFMIAVGSGDNESLNMIQQMYKGGNATKDDYAKALLAYQAYLDEVRSDQRDQAAVAYGDECKYM